MRTMHFSISCKNAAERASPSAIDEIAPDATSIEPIAVEDAPRTTPKPGRFSIRGIPILDMTRIVDMDPMREERASGSSAVSIARSLRSLTRTGASNYADHAPQQWDAAPIGSPDIWLRDRWTDARARPFVASRRASAVRVARACARPTSTERFARDGETRPVISDIVERLVARPISGLTGGGSVMGAILELTSYAATPVGMVAIIAIGAAAYFAARWVLSD